MSRGKGGNNKRTGAARSVAPRSARSGGLITKTRLQKRNFESSLYERAIASLERELDNSEANLFGDTLKAPNLIGRLERELLGEHARNQTPLKGRGVKSDDIINTREARMWSRADEQGVALSANRIMAAINANPDIDLKELVLAESQTITTGDLWSRPVDAIINNEAVLVAPGKNLGRKGQEMHQYQQVEFALAGITAKENKAISLETSLSADEASRIIQQAFKDTIGKRTGVRTVVESNTVSPF